MTLIKQIVMSTILTIMAFGIVFSSNVLAQAPLSGQSSEQAAALGPAELTISILAAGGGANVLLLVDSDTAGTTALVDALVAAGNTVARRPAPEYTWDTTDPSLDSFDCVIHLDGFTFDQSLPVASQEALVDFVRNGGGFIASQWDGYERVIGTQTDMNDLVLQLWSHGTSDNCEACNMTYTTVAGQEGHPVLAGIPSPFDFYADGHDAGEQVIFAVDPSTVLMTSTSGGPAVLVREFEEGRVVNFGHAANYLNEDQTLQDPNILSLYNNSVDWACDPKIEVAIDIKFCSDPNAFNCKKKGVLPVTIFGTDSFDVADIDISSLQLCTEDLFSCTNAPTDYSIADRGDPTSDLGAAQCAMLEVEEGVFEEQDYLNPDGFRDLDAAFEASEVQDMLGTFCSDVKGATSEPLVITGTTLGGTTIFSVPLPNLGTDQLWKVNK
jgi:hypothetical protein